MPLPMVLPPNDYTGTDESEYLSRSHYISPTRLGEQRIGDEEVGPGQEDNTQLDFWNFDMQHDNYSSLNRQSRYHGDEPYGAIGGERGESAGGTIEGAETNIELDAHEQEPPPIPVHRHRRHQSRRHRRHQLLPELEHQPQPEQEPEQEPEIVDDLDLDLSDEERRVLAEFDAAVRHARSNGGTSVNLSWGAGFTYGFGEG